MSMVATPSGLIGPAVVNHAELVPSHVTARALIPSHQEMVETVNILVRNLK